MKISSLQTYNANFNAKTKRNNNQHKKPITQGLDYTPTTLASATAENETGTFMLKRIPSVINSVDRVLAQNGNQYSEVDRDDMIQEAILSDLEKLTQKPDILEKRSRIPTLRREEEAAARNWQEQEHSDCNQPLSTVDKNIPEAFEDVLTRTTGKERVSEVINETLDTLADREQKVLSMLYGLDDRFSTEELAQLEDIKKRHSEEPTSLHTRSTFEVGEFFNVRPVRIKQVENKAIHRIRTSQRLNDIKGQIFQAPNGEIYSLRGTSNKKIEK